MTQDQQVVAWMYTHGSLDDKHGIASVIHHAQAAFLKEHGWTETPLYTTPKSSEGELIDEAVAVLRWVRANYASGSTAEINNRIDAFLAKAGKAQS